MKMSKLLVAGLLLCVSAGAFADDCEDSVGRTGASIETKAAMLAACRDAEVKKTQNDVVSTTNSIVDPKNVSSVVNQSEQIATALTKAAVGVGLAADTFIKTDAGKFVAVMIAWRVMGADILNVFASTKSFIFGILSIIAVFFITRGILVKYVLGYKTIDVPNKEGTGTVPKLVVNDLSDVSEGQSVVAFGVAALTCLFSVIILVNFIL